LRRKPLAAHFFVVQSLASIFSTWNLLVDRVHSRISRGEGLVSFVVWKILRLLPKPLLFILMFFLLGAVARA